LPPQGGFDWRWLSVTGRGFEVVEFAGRRRLRFAASANVERARTSARRSVATVLCFTAFFSAALAGAVARWVRSAARCAAGDV
jgi:hypothetical protein